jgi:hypothetical protein
MKGARELFIEESNRFYERLDKVLASVDQSDDQWVHQTFDIPKRQLEKIDVLVKSGKRDLIDAEERRLRIMLTAWPIAYRRVLNSWNTRDRLAVRSTVWALGSSPRNGGDSIAI